MITPTDKGRLAAALAALVVAVEKAEDVPPAVQEQAAEARRVLDYVWSN